MTRGPFLPPSLPTWLTLPSTRSFAFKMPRTNGFFFRGSGHLFFSCWYGSMRFSESVISNRLGGSYHICTLGARPADNFSVLFTAALTQLNGHGVILVPHCGFVPFVFYFHLLSDSYFISFFSLPVSCTEEESTNLFLFYLVVLFVIKFSFLFYLRGIQNGKRYIKSF